MLDFFEWGQMLVHTLSEIGDWLLYRPFFSLFTAFETIAWYQEWTGHNVLISSKVFAQLASLFDFTIGELVFSSLIGTIIGIKFIKFLFGK